MKIRDFVDRHKDETMLCVATGPSLNNVPVDFLRSYPSVGVNYLPYYSNLLDGYLPNYWTALDTMPMELLDTMPEEVVRFVPVRQKARIEAANRNMTNVCFYDAANIRGPNTKIGFSTTTVAAALLCVWMGAKNILVVGFDCSKGNKSDAVPEPGKTGTPHFYDPDRGKQYMPGWDKNMGQVLEYVNFLGRSMYNLSDPTLSTMIPRSTYQEWEREAK